MSFSFPTYSVKYVEEPSYSVQYIQERLRQPQPLDQEEIKKIQDFFNESNSVVNFDETHSLNEIISHLYQAVFFSKIEMYDKWTSSTEAVKLIDKGTEEILFVAKTAELTENLGVPQSGSVEREHLYHLLGPKIVPPAFVVKFSSSSHSVSLFLKDCEEWNEKRTEDRKKSLRKIFIHQYRTVNQDPSSKNIFISKNNSKEAFAIDGGYTLPFNLDRKGQSFKIANWPPLREKPYLDEAFTQEEKEELNQINIEEDLDLIKKHLSNEKNVINQILKIYRVAYLLLTKAASLNPEIIGDKEITITLQDLCAIREIRVKDRCLFQSFLENKNISEINDQIDSVFHEILEIKKKIHTNKELPFETLTTRIFKELDKKNVCFKKLAAIYILGKEAFWERFSNKDYFGNFLNQQLTV